MIVHRIRASRVPPSTQAERKPRHDHGNDLSRGRILFSLVRRGSRNRSTAARDSLIFYLFIDCVCDSLLRGSFVGLISTLTVLQQTCRYAFAPFFIFHFQRCVSVRVCECGKAFIRSYPVIGKDIRSVRLRSLFVIYFRSPLNCVHINGLSLYRFASF